MSRTLLVTGGCGFIGSNFIRFVMENRPTWRVINLDALTYAGDPGNLADVAELDEYEFIAGDVADLACVMSVLPRVDAVAHFAAESHVDRSIDDADSFVRTNVVGTQTLLDAMRRTGHPGRFLHVSTDEVYGSLPLDRPGKKFSERDAIAPNSPYAASKAAADCFVRAANKTYAVDTVITRGSNTFGPRQHAEKVIPRFVRCLSEGSRIPLYGDGRNVRDWLHVDDHAEAILRALEYGESGGVYNIGGNNERSNIELAHEILRYFEYDDGMIDYVDDRPGHDLRYAVDTSRAERVLNWRPTRSAWPGALRQTIRWYLDHRGW